MNRIIITSIIALASFMGMTLDAKAQITPGATAADFTMVDLEGDTHNLYSYLEAGKTVILDISATWCGPCWIYKSSGALKELYLKHGPAGTCSQDVIVLFLEGDTTTLTEALYGLGTDFTMGDWVSGTPYPIIDIQQDAQGIAFFDNYPLEGFPTLVRICPDKKMYEFSYYIDGTVPNMEAAIATCTPAATDAGISSIGTGFSCTGDLTPNVSLKNSGTVTITSATLQYAIDGGTPSTYTYSGTLPAGDATTITLPTLTGVSNGYHVINANILTVNGGADGNQVNNCLNSPTLVNNTPAVMTPYSQDFSNPAFPYDGWIIENLDNDTTWRRTDTITGGALMIDNYSDMLPGSKDGFYVIPLDLSPLSKPELTFDLAYAPFDSNYSETLEVFITKDCGANWQKVYEKTGLELSTAGVMYPQFYPTSDSQWRTEHISLASFIGSEQVIIKFVNTSGYSNNLFIDNISVGNDPTNIKNAEGLASDLKVYPNPTTDRAKITVTLPSAYPCTIVVTDALGNQVHTSGKMHAASGSFLYDIDTKEWSDGLYFIRLQLGGYEYRLKLTKQ